MAWPGSSLSRPVALVSERADARRSPEMLERLGTGAGSVGTALVAVLTLLSSDELEEACVLFTNFSDMRRNEPDFLPCLTLRLHMCTAPAATRKAPIMKNTPTTFSTSRPVASCELLSRHSTLGEYNRLRSSSTPLSTRSAMNRDSGVTSQSAAGQAQLMSMMGPPTSSLLQSRSDLSCALAWKIGSTKMALHWPLASML
mmetsp:Transcript_78828/g.182862  ORF Transcript_78828/g.182862 Transcript_78828/m.182862 type:complete len:200 (+) Transcript_78828:437-1036(+)